MKTRSKIFTTADVQAILDKRKTMFREPVKPQPTDCSATHKLYKEAEWRNEPMTFVEHFEKDGTFYCKYCGNGVDGQGAGFRCPYGEVGDVIYVRETTWEHGYYYTGQFDETGEYETRWIRGNGISYAATDKKPEKYRTIPSAVMPRKYARIWLQITDIKVERWRDITEEDAIAEGVERNRDGSWHDYLEPNRLYQDCPKASFYSLCLKNHGYKKWIDNPWVWAISFKVLSTTGKPELKL